MGYLLVLHSSIQLMTHFHVHDSKHESQTYFIVFNEIYPSIHEQYMVLSIFAIGLSCFLRISNCRKDARPCRMSPLCIGVFSHAKYAEKKQEAISVCRFYYNNEKMKSKSMHPHYDIQEPWKAFNQLFDHTGNLIFARQVKNRLRNCV